MKNVPFSSNNLNSSSEVALNDETMARGRMILLVHSPSHFGGHAATGKFTRFQVAARNCRNRLSVSLAIGANEVEHVAKPNRFLLLSVTNQRADGPPGAY